MTYSLSGEFYEACDCEVVCSCWAGVPPDMGICTGLFAWHITAGVVGGVDVSNCSAMLIFNGTSCDLASHVLLLVQANSPAQQAAVEAAIKTGPWADVVRLDAAVIMPASVSAVIAISPQGGNKVRISATGPDILAEAYCRFEGFKLQGGPAGSLVRRSTGKTVTHTINVGQVYTDAGGSGLNLLATNADVPPYTFDLDLTDISAVSGKFNYVLV